MSAAQTNERQLGVRVTEAVDLSRHHALLLAVLMFVPVPLLTFGGLAVPFPELAQRALAPLLPFVEMPGEAEGASFSGSSLHTLGIQPAAGESYTGGSADAPRSVVLTSVVASGPAASSRGPSSAVEPVGTSVFESFSGDESATGPEISTGEDETASSGDSGATDDSSQGGSSSGGDVPGTSDGSSGGSGGGSGGSGSSGGGSGSGGGSSGSGSGNGGSSDTGSGDPGSGGGGTDPPVVPAPPVVPDPPVVTDPEIPPVPDPPAESPVPGAGNGNGNGSGNGNSGGGNAGGSGNAGGNGKGKGRAASGSVVGDAVDLVDGVAGTP